MPELGRWVPEEERGVRWDDPELAIEWPLATTELSDRDRSLPLMSDISPTL